MKRHQLLVVVVSTFIIGACAPVTPRPGEPVDQAAAEKRIECPTYVATGTRLGARKVCSDHDSTAAQDALRDIQQQGAMQGSSMSGN